MPAVACALASAAAALLSPALAQAAAAAPPAGSAEQLRIAQVELQRQPQFQRPALQTDPRLRPPQKRAMVIVVEENDSVNFSVTWRGLSQSLTSFEYDQLLPAGIRPVIKPIVDTSVTLASALGLPAATLADEISRVLGRQVTRMLGEHIAVVAAQAGLPAGGCARQIFDTLGNAGIRTGKDPMAAFLDVYGETAMAQCLKTMAEPYYDTVVVLNDSAAGFQAFSDQLLQLHQSNHVIDVFINLHGCGEKAGDSSALNNTACGDPRLVFAGGAASPAMIENIKARNGGQPLNINAVYQVSCWGSEFNAAWRNLGARAANGARELNYYILLSPFVYMDRFTRGNRTLQQAAQDAYLADRSLLNGKAFTARLDLRPFLNRTFPPPRFGIDLIAGTCPGGTRNGCNWSFTPPYSAALNQTLSRVKYGHDKTRPVNHSASSVRHQRGPTDVRRALAANDTHDGLQRLAHHQQMIQ
jgi:hypothetical protein